MKPRVLATFGRDARFPEWCLVCCTQHSVEARCPGEIHASGPERHGYKVTVETEHSMEAYGVLIAPAGKLWRARILTYPRSLWTVPGGTGTLKFIGTTPQFVEEQAIRFIAQHCVARGYTQRHGLAVTESVRSVAADATRAAHLAVTPRWPLVLPVRYELRGADRLTLFAVTRNVSAGGVFVQTPSPVKPGADLLLQIRLQEGPLAMHGNVIWATREDRLGRPPGMGVQLVMPPKAYLTYIGSLPPPSPGEGT